MSALKKITLAPYLLFINEKQRFNIFDTAFIFAVKGTLEVEEISRDGSFNTCIPEGEIFSLNSQGIYKLTAKRGSLGCILIFPIQYCEKQIPDLPQILFTIAPKENTSFFKNYYQTAQQNFAKLILLWISENGHSSTFERKALEFLNFNLKYFSELNSENRIISDVIKYIKLNYNRPIDLQNISNNFYLSNSYISRLFSKSTGIKLHNFLSRLRIAEAINILTTTNKDIDFIATEIGFNNTRTFDRLFKKITNLSPSEYRELYGNEKRHLNLSIESNKNIITFLKKYLEAPEYSTSKINSVKKTEYSYSVDFLESNVKRYPQFQLPKVFIIIGNPHQLLRKDVQKQLSEITKSIRPFSICMDLNTNSFSPQKDSNLKTISSIFEVWDEIFNYLTTQNIAPLMIVHEENFIKNIPLFEEFCVHFSNLLNTENSHQNWRFLFKPSESNQTHITSKAFIKFVNLFNKFFTQSKYGISLGNAVREKACLDLLHPIVQSQTSIDFLDYSLNQNDDVDSDKHFLSAENDDQKLKVIKKVLKILKFNAPIYLLNWNTITGQTEFTNGHFFRGALIAKNIIDRLGEIDGIGFWINTEILESANGNKTNGLGISLMHYHNGKRPAFYSLSLLSRLRGQLIFCNNHVLVTTNNDSFELLLLNPTIFDPKLSNNKILLREEEIKLNIILNNLPNSKYRIKKYQFDMLHGALYYLTNSLQTPSGMDKETIDYVSQHATPKLSVYETKTINSLQIAECLTYNAMELFIVKNII